MSFFYDLNKKLDGIRATPEVTHQQLNERDMGKHNNGKTTGFKAVADKAAKEYGSKAAGERVAGAVKAKMAKAGKYDEGQDFGPGRAGPNKNQAGPNSINPDFANYKTPNFDKDRENTKYIDKEMGDGYSEKRWPASYMGAMDYDATGQNKYVDRTTPGVINKIKDKLGYDMPDPAYGPRPDETQRLAKRYPAPTKESAGPAAAAPVKKASPGFGKDYKPLVPDTEKPGSARGTIKGGTFQADPKGRVKPPGGDPEGVREAGAPMTAKQKSFAKLAPPADKITFADKIAGAKKEVDEMLGDVAAEAMRSALGGGRGRNAEMDEENAFTAHKRPSADRPKVGSTERGHKHDIKHTATGRIVTRRVDDQGNSVGADDDSTASGEKRGRGRPKGTKQSIGAKGPSGKSKLMTKEGEVDIRDQGEYDQEGDMAKDDIKTIVRHAQALSKVLGDNDNLPEWVQSKLAKIEGMMISIDEYMQNQAGDNGEEEPIAEKAVSKQQQKFMGMAHAMQKGEKVKGASNELKKVAKTMKPTDTEDFAKTKHKGLPDKVKSKKKEESVEESDTAAAPKSGGMGFGKGIYDSMNRELENMIAESMNINMSDSTEGDRSLTVTATDEDAMRLAVILKSAGLGGQGRELQSDESCSTCGMPDCGCGDVQEAVDENAPDWPTNTETSPDALQYAGGLNKPKTDVAGDGQTTIPNTAVHAQDEDALRRMMEMAGMSQNNRLDEGMMDKIKGMLVPKLMKLLGPDADNIANAVRQATGGDLTPSKENAMKVVQALGIDKAATQGQSQMAEGIAGNWQGKLIQSLYTLGLLGSAAVTNWAYGPGRGTDLGVASGIITMIGVVLLMFAATFFSSDRGMVGAMGRHGNKGFDTNKGPNSLGEDDLDRMMEMAGVKKKEVDEEKTEEGNKFTGNLAKARADGKKEADLDGDGDMEKVRESIFSLTNQWKTYKG